MRKSILIVFAILGGLFLAFGWLASLSAGGSKPDIVALGHALIVAGAIIVAGVLISLAIVETKPKGSDDERKQ